MEVPLKSVLLIDDDEATNFLHQLIIKKSGLTENINIARDGKEALRYLTSVIEGKHALPELIFLDINMPIMDGWEFLDEYQKLPLSGSNKPVLLILTASENPADEKRARDYLAVSGFLNKPLTVEVLQDIPGTYFK